MELNKILKHWERQDYEVPVGGKLSEQAIGFVLFLNKNIMDFDLYSYIYIYIYQL